MTLVTKDTAIMGRANIGGGSVTYKFLPIRNTGTTVEQDTGFDLPASCIIPFPPYVLISAAASAASRLDVGLLASESGGDANGFLASVSTTATGIKLGAVSIATTGVAGSSGVTADFLTASTIGVLLSTFLAGTTDNANYGTFVPKPHASDVVTSKSISWTSNATSTTLRGTIIVPILEFS